MLPNNADLEQILKDVYDDLKSYTKEDEQASK